MNSDQIHSAAADLLELLVEKDVPQPRVEIRMHAGLGWRVCFWGEGVDPGTSVSGLWQTDFGEIDDLLRVAEKHARSLPTKDERDTADFRRSLAELIHQGREVGVDLQFLNPLTEMMQKLSSNAITKEAA